jgi:hypothetical protein
VRKACIDLLGHVRLRRFDLLATVIFIGTSLRRFANRFAKPFGKISRRASDAGDDPSAGLTPLSGRRALYGFIDADGEHRARR